MNIRTIRRTIQISALLLITAIPLLNVKGMSFINGSLYSLSFGPLWITDPLSGLQTILSSLSLDMVLVLSMLLPVLLALVFGRVFCGWFCPQNTISELADYLAKKFRVKRLTQPPLSSRPRYMVLLVLLVAAPLLGFPVANLISAPGIISVQVSKYIYEGVVGLELGLIGLIILSEVFVTRRLWCNYICPVGSVLGTLRTGKTLKVVFNEDAEHACGGCLECVEACGLGLDPMGDKIYPLCHNCGNCVETCKGIQKNNSPLSFRF